MGSRLRPLCPGQAMPPQPRDVNDDGFKPIMVIPFLSPGVGLWAFTCDAALANER